MVLSIITVNLNNASGLRNTIKSVINQTYTNYEYIIIDGGSTDGSREVIKEYTNRITYWVSETDNGIYNAMNKGILQANGEYLLFLNSGDWLFNNTILSRIFELPKSAEIIYGNLNVIMKNGESKLQTPLIGEMLTLANFNTNTRSTISHPASFIHKTLFERGLYDESYKIIADINFFIDRIIIQNCSVEYIPYIITNFNSDGVSSNPSNWAQTIEERTRIFKELLPPRILKDYELIFQVKDSSLLKFIPFLEKTTGLNNLATKILRSLIKLYKIIKGLD